MTMSLNESNEAQFCGGCTDPVARERVFGYLADLLEDSAVEGVEDHLLDCRPCREFFLTMLNVRGEARAAQNLRGEMGRVSNDALVTRLADFKKKGA